MASEEPNLVPSLISILITIMTMALFLPGPMAIVEDASAQIAVSIDVEIEEERFNMTVPQKGSSSFVLNGTVKVQKPPSRFVVVEVALTTTSSSIPASVEPTSMTFDEAGKKDFNLTLTVSEGAENGTFTVSVKGRATSSSHPTVEDSDKVEISLEVPEGNDGEDGKNGEEEGGGRSGNILADAGLFCGISVAGGGIVGGMLYLKKRGSGKGRGQRHEGGEVVYVREVLSEKGTEMPKDTDRRSWREKDDRG